MVLLIDNYDSFSYNLYQLIGGLLEGKDEIRVIRNDEYTVEEIEKMNPSHIVISPGPGRPVDAGICEELVRRLNGNVNILGVCLGHQGICEAFGGTVTYAKKQMHGKQSLIELDNNCPIFNGIPNKTEVARYHSLAVGKDSLPDNLYICAKADDGEIMAVAEKNNKTFGLQFHPESIMTEFGEKMLSNFLSL